MVDAFVFADSYAIGAKNHQAFFEKNKDNPQAAFVFLDNTGVPKLTDSVPSSALNLDRKSLADYAVKVIEDGDAIPAHVKRGATIGLRVWGKP